MADFNKVFLIGRLTADPELRYTPGGAGVADLRIATTRKFATKDGDAREDKLFIDVTVWNRQAETCCQYLKKGKQVHVEGYLKMEQWEDKTTGEKRTKIKVEGDRVQFLDSPNRDERNDDDQSPDPYAAHEAAQAAPASRPSNAPAQAKSRPTRAPAPQAEPLDDDDVPF